MKNFILIGCLIGGIFAYSGELAPTTSMQLRTMDSSCLEAKAPAQAVSKIVTASMTPITVAHTTYTQAQTLIPEVVKPSFKLQSVNGITLYDDPSTLVKKLGEPKRIAVDPYFKEMSTYDYPNMAIVFSDGLLYSLEIPEGASVIVIDGTQIAATVEALEEALGQPDYTTEDGIVFERGEALLKLFIDVDSNKLTSIHYFHSSSM
ncbi:hypothetical protein [Paenibacillus sinopodophylli]|uniref:hypothetical protein n=1 Tax=Paenibacillus sinopodophylli TaxID=1837342 RepID=UPI00110D198B|nr:hypothetical protein [Paenibacillus sinopodophylli]